MPAHKRFLHQTGLLIPRVRPIDRETLPFLYRWCFDDEELTDLWTSGGLFQLKGLNATVSFRRDKRNHRRREFKEIDGKWGWLRVVLGCVGGEESKRRYYVLFSAFTDIGLPVEFATVNSLFDHVESVEALDGIPAHVEQRFQQEVGMCIEISAAHLNEKLKKQRKQEIAELEEFYEEMTQQTEDRLASLNQRIRNSAASAMDESSEQGNRSILKEERTKARLSLIETEAKELKSIAEVVRRHSAEQNSIEPVVLYTIHWRVLKS